MDYFIMRQDHRILYMPQLMLPKSLQLDNITREQIESFQKTDIIYVKENQDNEYPGYIEKSIKLISNRIMRIMSKYQQNIIFKPVILIEKENNRQVEYHFMVPPEIECGEETSIRDAVGNVKEFILDEKKVGSFRIFLARDYGNNLLVRLDVAESILRREVYGVSFEKVNMTRKGD